MERWTQTSETKTSSEPFKTNTSTKFHWPRLPILLSKMTGKTTSQSTLSFPRRPSPRKASPTTIRVRLWMIMAMTHLNFPPLPTALPRSNPSFSPKQKALSWNLCRSRAAHTKWKFPVRWIVKLLRGFGCPKPRRSPRLPQQTVPPTIPGRGLSRRTGERTCMVTPSSSSSRSSSLTNTVNSSKGFA